MSAHPGHLITSPVRRLTTLIALLASFAAALVVTSTAAHAFNPCNGDDPPPNCYPHPTPKPPAPVVIRGQFTYLDDNTSGGTFQRPLAYDNLEIWRYAPGTFGIWGWSRMTSTTTDGNGNFSVSTALGTSGTVYAVRVFATNYAARVYPQTVIDGGPYWSEPGAPGASPIEHAATYSGQVLDFSYGFADRNRAKYYNLAEDVRQARMFADARRSDNDPIPVATVQPAAVTTFYNPVGDEIDVAGGDTYQDLTVIHEYAHFLEAHIGSFYAMPSEHTGCTATVLGVNVQTPELAWMEGFAEWFAAAVNRSAPSAMLVGSNGSFTAGQLESPYCALPASVDRASVEYYVAGSLWDMTDSSAVDGTQESWDTMGDQDATIFAIMDYDLDSSRMPTNVYPSIYSFATAYVQRGGSYATLAQELGGNGIHV